MQMPQGIHNKPKHFDPHLYSWTASIYILGFWLVFPLHTHHEYWIRIRIIKHVKRDLFRVPILQKIKLHGNDASQNIQQKRNERIHKMCHIFSLTNFNWNLECFCQLKVSVVNKGRIVFKEFLLVVGSCFRLN